MIHGPVLSWVMILGPLLRAFAQLWKLIDSRLDDFDAECCLEGPAATCRNDSWSEDARHLAPPCSSGHNSTCTSRLMSCGLHLLLPTQEGLKPPYCVWPGGNLQYTPCTTIQHVNTEVHFVKRPCHPFERHSDNLGRRRGMRQQQQQQQ